MKKGGKAGREADCDPESIRSRIQTLLREKETKKSAKGLSLPRSTAGQRTKEDSPARAGLAHFEDSFSTAISPLNRSFTPKSRPILKCASGAQTVKSVKRSFNFTAKKVNLLISQEKHLCASEKKAVFPLPPSDESKETIVSVLNSTVSSPQKPHDHEIERLLQRTFHRDSLRLVKKGTEAGTMPEAVLVLHGTEWRLYDVVQ